MSEQQVNNLIEKLSGVYLLNKFVSSKHEGKYLHLMYANFKLLDYEALIDFCDEEDLLFYSYPRDKFIQLSLFNDPEFDDSDDN